MQLKDKHGLQWLQFESFTNHSDLIHGFTTRNGGVSDPPFSSLNMGRRTTDDPANIEENYRRILSALNVYDRPRYMTKQVHSDRVVVIDSACEDLSENFVSDTDGLLTNRTDTVLMTYYADCVPLYFYDPVNHAGGIVHSGWKGTSKQIGKRAVQCMQETYGSEPENIIAGIGPCAGQCCYEVDDFVVNHFQWMEDSIHAYLKKTGEGHYLIDLKGINRAIMMSAGLKEENIEISDLCTMCRTDLLFSYRKEKPKQGLMSAIFALNEKK